MQGPETAAEVNVVLKREKLEDDFPLFTAVHRSYYCFPLLFVPTIEVKSVLWIPNH
jgi:hypothetical protein